MKKSMMSVHVPITLLKQNYYETSLDSRWSQWLQIDYWLVQ